jgi:hypothetical protein
LKARLENTTNENRKNYSDSKKGMGQYQELSQVMW